MDDLHSDHGPDGRSSDHRLSFLLPDLAEEGWTDPGDEDGRLHRLLSFLGAVSCSYLIHERVIDEQISQAFRGVLRNPTVLTSARFLESLIAGRKMKVTDLLGGLPVDSSRSLMLTSELLELLRAVRREKEGDGADGPIVVRSALFEFFLAGFEGEFVAGRPGDGPTDLSAAARPGPLPEDGPGAYLVRRDGSRQPLHPFVLVDNEPDSLSLLHDFEAGHLRHRRVHGEDQSPRAFETVPDFFLEFLLKMGAYGEVREWLKGMRAEERAELNRRNILYAGFCHYGSLYLRQREFQQAVVELEKAVKIRPDLVLAHLYLAQGCMNLKQFDRAVSILKRHAVHFNRSDRIFELIGDCYRQKDEADTALRMYEKAVALNPFNAQVEKKRGLLKDEQKKSSEQTKDGSKGAARLDEMLTDMTLDAELGLYTNTLGRDEELTELVSILSCRDKRNPLLLGEVGVGKTTLVEEFALRLVQGRLPARFRGKRVYLMSMATLLAGAKFRGQFEERVLDLVKALKAEDCILFIDNIHTIVSAGLTRGGTLDTSNILKPFLLRGEIQVIGATTHEEHRGSLEKDPSLMRCFQTLTLEEPSVEEAADMICEVRGRYESHHRVVLPEKVIRQTLPLIASSVRERALPDKALDVFDRAGAVASLARVKDAVDAEASSAFSELTEADILAVLAEMTGIPVARLSEDARARYRDLQGHLAERVIGQDDAVIRVSHVLRAARTGLVLDERRPKGVFLFVGPTGVGKTELARGMAEMLFGSVDRLIRIDMSEYMEKINQSRLIGTAPGYVGYNDPNQLTDEVRKNPHSLVLLDEIEKADTNLLNLFLQVFDAGRLTDGKGRTIHFDNTTIVMTSNVGTELYSRASVGFDGGREGSPPKSELLRQVHRTFTPEFLNRVDEVICFAPLSKDSVAGIARLKLKVLVDRFKRQGKRLEVSDGAVACLAREGYSFEQGARSLERTMRRLILEPLALRALEGGWEEATAILVEDAGDGALRFELLAEPAEPLVDEPELPLEQDESSRAESE